MSSPAKTESMGWFSRIFRGSVQSVTDGSSHSAASTNSPAPISSPLDSPATINKRVADARNLLKDLSPANGSARTESTITGKGLRSLTSPVSTQKNTISEVQKRKRLHVEEPKEQFPLEDIFSTATAKRFCGNMSLIEEPIAISVPERLDATWSGEMGLGINASPASSVRSLKSRLSGAASTTSSGLSSRTRAILNQLEKVHTPAKEARRLPLMRAAGAVSERWNHASAVLNSPGAPPLRKAKLTATPTRLQLLSTNLGFNKKPYWKDIYRRPVEQNNDAERNVPVTVDRNDLNGSLQFQLAPIFDVAETPKTKHTAPAEPERRVSKIKGIDGKSRNVFNTKELEEDEVVNTIPVPKPISMKTTAPQEGFLDGMNFKFDLPKERTSFGSAKGKVTPEPPKDDAVSSDDASDESVIESESSESNESEPEVEAPKMSPKLPVLETKKSITPPPMMAAATTSTAAKWSCPECFVENTADKCVCCGAAKDGGSSGPAPKKDLISNINTFAPKATTTVSFGFSGSAAPSAAPVTAPAPAPVFGASKAPLFGAPKEAPSKAPVEEKKADGETRVDWSCPDCCVDNKANQDSCACCGHVKYKSAGGASTSVFGANAFKPTTSTSGVSFGLSASGSAPAPSSTFSFGLGASKPVEPAKEDTVKADAPAVSTTAPASTAVSSTSTIPSITISDTTKSATTTSFGTGSSLFGNSAPKFNGFGAATAPMASNAMTSASTSTTAPLFGTAKPAETTAPTFTAPAVAPLGNLFGGSSTSAIGTSGSTTNLFGNSAKPAESTGSSGNLFSAITANNTAATSSAPQTSTLFGKPKENGVTATATTAAPVAAPVFAFGASTSTVSTPLFGDKPAEKPLFGGSQDKPLFGASVAAAPAPTFGGFSASSSTPAAAPAPTFGNLSQSQPVSNLFGAPKVDDAPAIKKGMFSFGATNETPAPAPTAAFSQSSGNLFGTSAPAAPSLFGSQPSGSSLFGTPAPAAAPTLSASSSTSSLFGATEPPASFNFGASAAPAGNQPFVFGSVPQPAGGLSFGAMPAAPAVPGGAFAYNAASSAGARKIATARRRMAGRK